MSEQYKMQRIKEYLIFHIKDSKERIELLDYLDQLQQKENIIKEVREYFKNHTLKYDDLMLIKPSDVFEILDKENI